MNGGARVVLFGDEAGLPRLIRLCRQAGLDIARAVTDPARASVRRLPPDYPDVAFAWHPDKAGRADFLESLAAARPDLGLIWSYSRILWPELIELFPLGVVNVHGGRLPQYRGANVLQWTIINGESLTAASLHYIDAGVDTGPVIEAACVPIGPDDDAVSLRDKLLEAGSDLFRSWLPRLAKGRVPAKEQNPALARTWPRRGPEDGLIDWTWPDGRIRDLIRALVPPWPGAYYLDREGRKVVFTQVPALERIAEERQTALQALGVSGP